MKFTLNYNLIVQFCALVIHALNITTVPAKDQLWVALAVAIVQGVSAWAAHQVNPDGTPAAVPYVKK